MSGRHVADMLATFPTKVRAIIYSIPFNSLTAWMLVHAVLFVTKQLNLFSVKGELSSKLSPKQIMSGEVIHYCLVWATLKTIASSAILDL